MWGRGRYGTLSMSLQVMATSPQSWLGAVSVSVLVRRRVGL